MEVIFQICANQNIDFGFGDEGVGYISSCFTHKIFAFNWNC